MLIFEPSLKTFEKINKTSIVSKNVPWSKDFSDRMTPPFFMSLLHNGRLTVSYMFYGSI